MLTARPSRFISYAYRVTRFLNSWQELFIDKNFLDTGLLIRYFFIDMKLANEKPAPFFAPGADAEQENFPVEARPIISKHALERLVRYLAYLKTLAPEGGANISATAIAEALELNQVQVRKDLACVSRGGKPKTGYVLADLITDIERFLNYDNMTDAVLAGAGNLGRALMSHANFAECGLNIVAGFDSNPELIGTEINGKKILSPDKIGNLCRRLNIRIGIITVPGSQAQNICDLMIAGGIRAIWNFSSANLSVPGKVVVKNESMVASFVVISQMLAQSFAAHGLD